MTAKVTDTNPAANPAMGMPPIGLGTIFRAVRRYSLVFILFILVAAGAGAAVYLLLPLPKMTGSVVFHVASTTPAVLDAPDHMRIDFGLYRQQQIAVLKSRQVVAGALSEPGVAELPMLDRAIVGDQINYVSNNLSVDFKIGPEYMRVLFLGDERDQLVTLLKAISSSYMRQAVEKDKNQRLAKLDQLKKLQDTYTEELRLNRSRIRKVMESLGSGDPLAIQIRERFLESTLGMTQNQLAGVMSSIREKTVESAIVENSLGSVPELPDAIVNDLIKLEPEYAKLQEQRTAMAIELENLGATLQPGVKTPRMQQLEAELALVRGQISKLPEKLKPEISRRYKDSALRSEREKLDSYKDKMKLLNNMQKVLVKDIDDMIAKRREMSISQFELETLKQEAIQTEIMAERISSEIEKLKPEIDAPTRVTLWEEPTAVFGTEGNKRTKYTAMAAGGILLLGLVLIQWLDFRNRRIHHIDDLTNGIGLTVLGSVPRIAKQPHNQRDLSSYHLLTESVNTTRTMLLAGTSRENTYTGQQGEKGRTILVTSATSAEGKTSLSTHLSVSLASAGRRVLLIDADMRRPAAHLVLDMPLGPGLSDYLVASMSMDEVKRATRINGLDIITAGAWNEVAVSALSTHRWLELLQVASEQYDFVMIDSPPILPVADSLTIAKHVQGVLISVMQDHSRYTAVQTACSRLSLIGANVLGVVMSGSTHTSAGYYYYGGYYNEQKRKDANPTGQSA